MSGRAGRARVLLYCRAPEGDVAPVEAAYHRISTDLAGTPGLRGNELLRNVHEPERFIVLSEWDDLAAFRAWEAGAAHRGTTSPLRQFQDRLAGVPFALCEVSAAY